MDHGDTRIALSLERLSRCGLGGTQPHAVDGPKERRHARSLLSSSRPGSRTPTRPSTAGRPVSTRWRRVGHYDHVAEGLRPRRGARYLLPAVRAADPPDVWLGARRVRLVASWTMTFGDLYRRNIAPIVDLCHFGVPDWLENFQNPLTSPSFSRGTPATSPTRFPWVQLYTPVNEMFITATFSASYGWWNEQLGDDRSFVTALKHIVQGERAGDGGDPQGAARRAVYPERVFGVLPRGEPGGHRACRDAELASGSSRST